MKNERKGSKNKDLYPLRISGDVLHYWERTGYRPREITRLQMIWHHWKHPLEKKLAFLKEYAGPVSEGGRDYWKDVVRERVEWEEKNLERLKSSGQGEPLFKLEAWSESDKEYYEVCCAKDYETALRSIQEKKKHRIRKLNISEGGSAGENPGHEEGCIKLNKKKEIQSYYLTDGARPPIVRGGDFLEEYVDIPHPFKPFDVVRMLDDPLERTGIVRFIRFPGEGTGSRDNPFLRYDDAAVSVEWVYRDGSFQKGHADPLRLEYDSRWDGALQSALAVMDGSDYLQTFQMHTEE